MTEIMSVGVVEKGMIEGKDNIVKVKIQHPTG